MHVDAEGFCPLSVFLEHRDDGLPAPVVKLRVEAPVDSGFVEIELVHDPVGAVALELVAVTAFVDEPERVVEPLGKVLVLTLVLRDHLVQTPLSQRLLHVLLSRDILHVRRQWCRWQVRTVIPIGYTVLFTDLLGAMRTRICENSWRE